MGKKRLNKQKTTLDEKVEITDNEYKIKSEDIILEKITWSVKIIMTNNVNFGNKLIKKWTIITVEKQQLSHIDSSWYEII